MAQTGSISRTEELQSRVAASPCPYISHWARLHAVWCRLYYIHVHKYIYYIDIIHGMHGASHFKVSLSSYLQYSPGMPRIGEGRRQTLLSVQKSLYRWLYVRCCMQYAEKNILLPFASVGLPSQLRTLRYGIISISYGYFVCVYGCELAPCGSTRISVFHFILAM